MALQSSGVPISANNINVELTYDGTVILTLNDAAVRSLAAVPSGQISFSNFYDKSFATDAWFRNVVTLIHADAANAALSSTLIDSSANNATVTNLNITGKPRQVSDSPYGNGNPSYWFNGQGAYWITSWSPIDQVRLSVADHASLQFGTGDFTIEFWVKTAQNQSPAGSYLAGYPQTTPILYKGPGPGPATSAWGFYYGLEGDAQFRFKASPTQPLPTARIADGNWHHCAMTRQSGTVRSFVDGNITQTWSDATSDSTSNGAVTYIGYRTAYEGGFTGFLSNLRIVKGTAVYTAAFTPSSSVLTAISGTSLLTLHGNPYPFDGSVNSHNIIAEGTGNNLPFNQGISYRWPTQTDSGPFARTQALSLSSRGASIELNAGIRDMCSSGFYTTIPAIGTGDFTFEFWYKGLAHVGNIAVNGQAAHRWLFNSGTGATAYGGIGASAVGTYLIFYINGYTVASAFYGYDDGGGQQIGYATGWRTAHWNHYAMVRTGGWTVVYENGVALGSSQTGAANLTSTTMHFGSYDGAALGGVPTGSNLWVAPYSASHPRPTYPSDVPLPHAYDATIGSHRIADIRLANSAVYNAGAYVSPVPRFRPPTSPLTAISGTQLLIKGQNPAWYNVAGTTAGSPAVSNVVVSTAQSKWGGSSLYFAGRDNYGTSNLKWIGTKYASGSFTTQYPVGGGPGLVINPRGLMTSKYGTNNSYTVEMWARFTAFPVAGEDVQYIWSEYSSANRAPGLVNVGYYWDKMAHNLRLQRVAGDGSTRLAIKDTYYAAATGSTALSTNTWYHIAYCINGSREKVFLNGILEIDQDRAEFVAGVGPDPAAAAARIDMPYFTSCYYLGGNDERCGDGGAASSRMNGLKGYVDDLRITAGLARYWTNFTPPTAAFLDYGTPAAPPLYGQVEYDTVVSSLSYYQTHQVRSFVVPAGVTSISTCLIGAGGGATYGTQHPTWEIIPRGPGGGGGGGLAYGTLSVTPGETLTVQIGGIPTNIAANRESWIKRGETFLIRAYGGGVSPPSPAAPAGGAGGSFNTYSATNAGGGAGGNGSVTAAAGPGGSYSGAGGGAGLYGASGANGTTSSQTINFGADISGCGNIYYYQAAAAAYGSADTNTVHHAGRGQGSGIHGAGVAGGYDAGGTTTAAAGGGREGRYFARGETYGGGSKGNTERQAPTYTSTSEEVYSETIDYVDYYDTVYTYTCVGTSYTSVYTDDDSNPSGAESYQRPGQGGAVRIIWGPGRSYPSTNTHNIVS